MLEHAKLLLLSLIISINVINVLLIDLYVFPFRSTCLQYLIGDTSTKIWKNQPQELIYKDEYNCKVTIAHGRHQNIGDGWRIVSINLIVGDLEILGK